MVLGTGGHSGAKNQAIVSIDQLIDADNLSFEGITIRKEGGAAKHNSSELSGAPLVLGGWDWIPGVQRSVIFTDAGDLLKDDGAGSYGTTLKSGLTTNNVLPVFVEGGLEASGSDRKLFVFTQKNVVQVLAANGATTSDLTTPPADWSGTDQPRFGLAHEGRIWGGGNANDPHRLYYSTSTDHEDFTSAGSGTISIYPGEGEYLVQAISYKGLVVCWKYPRGIYIIDTTDPTIVNWKVSKLSTRLGGCSEHCAIAIDNDILFMDTAFNFHLISSVTEFGNLGAFDLSSRFQYAEFLRDNANISQIKKVYGVYYAAKREVHFGIAQTGSTVNSARVVIDFNNPQTPRFRFSKRDTAVSLWMKRDSNGVERLTMGDNIGFVWDLDQETRSKDSSGYQGLFQTPHLDFAHINPALAAVNKNFDFLELIVEPSGNHNLNIDIYLDDALTQTITFNMGVTGSDLGSFVLGTDVLAGTKILNKKRRLLGSGRRISIVGRNNGDSQDFSVAKFLIHFKAGNEADLT
jgi:hypothetical protein|tara:strand:+ start:1385 stop:2941 length:1557 start_codon:yes stop_codon:yes gene_type:complete